MRESILYGEHGLVERMGGVTDSFEIGAQAGHEKASPPLWGACGIDDGRLGR